VKCLFLTHFILLAFFFLLPFPSNFVLPLPYFPSSFSIELIHAILIFLILFTILVIIRRSIFYLKFNSTLQVCPYLTENTLRLRYEPNRLLLSISLWRWYFSVIIIVLDIIHRFLSFKSQCFGDWLLSPTQLDPIDRARLNSPSSQVHTKYSVASSRTSNVRIKRFPRVPWVSEFFLHFRKPYLLCFTECDHSLL
jgi:hypothetical protein